MLFLVATVALLLPAAATGAGEALPPPPAAFFNDYAHFVPADEAARMNEKLRRFAEETSTQLLVVVFPGLPEGQTLEDFTVNTAQSWRVGQKKHDNGAVLFVFVGDRKMRLEVGYGLEGALPDAIAKRIIADVVTPELRAGNPARGLDAGIDAMIAATRGEYKAEPRRSGGGGLSPVVVLIFVVLLFIFISAASSRASRVGGPLYRSRTYGRRGPYWGGGGFGGFGGGGFGGGGGGGGGGGFGGGGFSGGGGSFGGGGASGSW